jgi:hypothetical protein
MLTTQEATVIEKEVQQEQIIGAPLSAQEEVRTPLGPINKREPVVSVRREPLEGWLCFLYFFLRAFLKLFPSLFSSVRLLGRDFLKPFPSPSGSCAA